MLRRRLIFNLGPLIVLLLVAAIVASWLLQGVLRDLGHINGMPWSEEVRAEQLKLTSSFRWLVLGFTVVFLVLINLSVIVLLRMGSIILRPMDKLVEATRRLGAEHFDYRISLNQSDEFGELAQAYNSMAQRLETNEQQRLQTLAQAAVAMNHELNNAISIIELQLALLSRQSGQSEALGRCLLQIHESLGRMTETVLRLKSIRRIVLTDYTPGTKMLDLQRSTAEQVPADKDDSGAFSL
jgi:nitrogen fixation/metabolism regulation signal transduction histidine kinase